jgi:hypothetical protein
VVEQVDGAWAATSRSSLPRRSTDFAGRLSFTDWVDGVPVSPNAWTAVHDDRDFGGFVLPSAVEFGHDVAIVREFCMRFGAAFGIGKADWEAWYRQLCRRPLDLWLSCWMIGHGGIDCDLHAFFGGAGCCDEGNAVQNIVGWVIRHKMAQHRGAQVWRDLPVVRDFIAERRVAATAAGVVADAVWDAEFAHYRDLLPQLDLRADFDQSSAIAEQIAASQARLKAREAVIGYRGWQPRRAEEPYSLKQFFDDSFWVALLFPIFTDLLQVVVDLRVRGVISQDKKLTVRVYGSTEPVVVQAAEQPLSFPATDGVVDILGADLDARMVLTAGWLENSPARIARAAKEFAALRTAANQTGNRRRLVDFKSLRSHICFLYYLMTYAPALRPLLCRPSRALAITGGLKRRVYGKTPLPLISEGDLDEAHRMLGIANRIALQPRGGALTSALGGAAIVHHDMAGAPEMGAQAFYILHPDGLRGGGSWMTAPDCPTTAVMTRFSAELLHGLSSGVGEFVVANAHLDCLLEQTAAETILEVLDNRGTTRAIIGLIGRTPRMAAAAIWRRDIMLKHRRRVVTIHRLRGKNDPADALSKGEYASYEAGIDSLGVPRPSGVVLTASDESMARIAAILALPAHEDDFADD